VSRSYCKMLVYNGRNYGYGNSHVKRRTQTRLYLRQLTINPELQDIVFPLYNHLRDKHHPKSFNYLSEIRNSYNLEMVQILGGHFCPVWSPLADEHFIEAFEKIKGIIPGGGRPFLFEWLEGRKAKKAVKAWRGDPFELLRHLTRRGIIEYAVRSRFRMETGK
jgi:hypothetical protein